MIDIYASTPQAEVVGIVAGDGHDIVLTRESGTAYGEPVARTGVHVWSFGQGRCHRFAAYGSVDYQLSWAGKQAAPNG